MQTRWPLAIVATATAPLSFRAAAIVNEAGRAAAVDVQGFVSDLGVAVLAAALAVALAGLHRALAVVWVAIFTAGHYANYELVVTLGAPATVRELHYLFDPTFVAGSALAVSQPLLLAFALAVAGVAAWLGATAERARLPAAALGGLLLCGVAAALPDSPEQPVWRQVDFLQRDAHRALAALRVPTRDDGPQPAPPEAMLAVWPDLGGDLSGAAGIPPTPRARNVLLVVLESISGLHLPSIAREHGRAPDAEMPALDAFARNSLRFSSFVTHQRKTNRGLYALLCGELPNLGDGTPKMSAAAIEPWRVCLPAVLRDAGFHTAYFQAAPLSFMLKDRFMPRAGFDEVDGFDGDEPSYTRSAWGVDDRAFFEQAKQRVDALRADGEPWFLTLLNVGTHHPYTVPDDYQPGPRSFGRAAAYLDEAFGAFAAGLEADGVLDDTLVVVTSDESLGIGTFDTEPAFKRLSQHWGVLLLRGPGIPEGVVREPFGLQDLALTLVDYLGIASRAGHFHGRSALRAYASPRALFFGNVNLASLGAFEPDGTLLDCNGAGQCRRYAVPDGRWFGPLGKGAAAAGDDVTLLRTLARASAPGRGHRPDAYALLPDPDVALDDDRPRMLHGGQYLHLDPGEWLEVEIDVTVEGDDAEVDWMHALVGFRNEGLVRERQRLRAGDRLRIAYRYAPEGEKGQIQCRTTVRRVAGGRAVLRHETATLRIHRADAPPPGATLLRFEVDRS